MSLSPCRQKIWLGDNNDHSDIYIYIVDTKVRVVCATVLRSNATQSFATIKQLSQDDNNTDKWMDNIYIF